MKLKLIAFLALVVIASGCTSITSDGGSDMNYTEAKEKSTTVVYDNLLLHPDRYRGTFIEEEGRIGQVLDGGLLLHTERLQGRSKPDVSRWSGNMVWVDIQNNFSIYQKDQYLKVFGEYKGTKTYEKTNGEYARVPRIGTSFVTDRINYSTRTYLEGSIGDKQVKVDRICVKQFCKTNTSNAEFRLKVGENYEIKAIDSKYGNHSKNETVKLSNRESNIKVGKTTHPPENIARAYVDNFPDSHFLLSSRIAAEDTEECRYTTCDAQIQRSRMRSAQEYASIRTEDVETIYKEDGEAKVSVKIRWRNGGYTHIKNTTVPLVKEDKSWKIDRAMNPYEPDQNINLDPDSRARDPVYPSN